MDNVLVAWAALENKRQLIDFEVFYISITQ